MFAAQLKGGSSVLADEVDAGDADPLPTNELPIKTASMQFRHSETIRNLVVLPSSAFVLRFCISITGVPNLRIIFCRGIPLHVIVFKKAGDIGHCGFGAKAHHHHPGYPLSDTSRYLHTDFS